MNGWIAFLLLLAVLAVALSPLLWFLYVIKEDQS